jgi:hypothetical protein
MNKSINETQKSTKVSEGKQLMLLRDISIWLDDYNDIFSDFDPRPYSERALSDDFMVEIRKVCRERKENISELKLLIPGNKRNVDNEVMITRRLHTFLRRQHVSYKEEYNRIRKKSTLFVVFGTIMMLIASYLSSLRSERFLINAVFVIFEPSGWFLLWSGLENFFYTSKQQKKEFDFFNKLSGSKISFMSI